MDGAGVDSIHAEEISLARKADQRGMPGVKTHTQTHTVRPTSPSLTHLWKTQAQDSVAFVVMHAFSETSSAGCATITRRPTS